MKHIGFTVTLAAVLVTGVARADYLVTDLGTLGGTTSSAGINASGQVVGNSFVSSFPRAFVYSNGKITNLGSLGGENALARGINDSGQVVGNAATADGFPRAFLYSDGKMTDLGTLGGDSSFAFGINASGQIVGYSFTPDGSQRAFVYSNGKMTDLGTLGGDTSSFATAINASGQIVGYSVTPGESRRAFVYSNGKMTDLNSLVPTETRWAFLDATGINDNGQISAYGRDAATPGLGHAFLLTPQVAAVPEPGSLTLAGLGALMGLAGLVRGRRK